MLSLGNIFQYVDLQNPRSRTLHVLISCFNWIMQYHYPVGIYMVATSSKELMCPVALI
jgi:hypothetical protein